MGRRQGEGLDRRSPSAFSFAARTQHRGVIVAARRTQCCTQASRRAGVPDRGGTQGPGSLSPPKCSLSLQLGGAGTYDPARQVALYSTWGRVPMAGAAVAAAAARHHPSSQTHTLLTPTHTARQSGLFGVPVHGTCPRYPSTTRRSLSVDIVAHKLPLFPLPGTPARQRESTCLCTGRVLQVLPCLPFLRLSFF